MTTIVYRDGVLAADSRAYAGDKKPVGRKCKLHKATDGTIFGISSSSVGADVFLKKWVEEGCTPTSADQARPESFEVLAIKPDGSVFYANSNLDLSGPLEAEYFAIGSGDQYALGALAMGATAEEAVKVATDLDVWTGGPVTVMRR